ncbi:hypothetical protein Zmor_003032 [Zophobas morio]|uniref:Zinc-finger domain-containing protein n=1 Tax=Zophobas morio TaxID=2755281 RepID=A0AA38HM47_9CUCU|nr:hypothetical protein Zmor_003032 [Zophobas morio]
MSEEADDIEALRLKNKQERDAFLANFMNDPLFVDMVKEFKSTTQDKNKNNNKVVPKRKRGDSVFRFTGSVPSERRSSARLQNRKPDYTHLDLPNDKILSHDSDDVDDLEEVVYRVKKRRFVSRLSTPAVVIPVEEVTEEMIEKIQTSGNKVYGANGTSCHQCRQKTVDTKTICRSGVCVGVRGQFCGICVINRYGEDPIKALKDPNWQCYVCRGCCNCSFCRLKEGKRPTGILAPLAKANGYKSVMEFLHSLRGYGDYCEPKEDPENLLGFEGNEAVMGGQQRIKIQCDYDAEAFKKFVTL